MVNDTDNAARDNQIERIQQLIMELASGNLGFRADISDNYDELDAITLGINMLAEELQATTVSKEYLGRIYRGVVDMLLVLNSDYTIQAVNAAVLQKLQYTEDDLIGQPVHMLLYRQETNPLVKIIRDLNKKGYSNDTERSFRTKKGKQVPVSISASVLYDNPGDVNGILLIAKDITKTKQTEEELRHKNEELNSFIYRISHDIKGPLSSVMGLVYLAKSDLEDREAVNQYIDLIEQSANRLDRVIADLLELGRLTQSKIKYSNVNPEVLVKEILQSVEYSPEFSGVSFIINTEEVPLLRTKKVLLKAAMQNLILNGIQYKKIDGEQQPFVKISAQQKENEIIISVTDNGIGMEKDTQENVFKMFFRGETSSRGTGLGLYIVRTSIEALKGKIELKSKPGQGTTFTIHLPKKG